MLMSHGAIVLAVDGGRMRLMRNRGRGRSIDLETIEERLLPNPATHDQSEPQPGRRFESNGPARSAYSSSDVHQRREDVFCREALDAAVSTLGDGKELVLIAPARVMGVLRKRLEQHGKAPVPREIVKDLAALAPQALSLRLREYES